LPPILQSPKGWRQNRVGARTIGGLQATQKLHGNQAVGNSIRSGGSTIVVCGSLRPRS
jgi:hypothetical protein